MVKLKIRKGDNVKVITGKDKGKTGKVIRVFPEENRAVVSGVNLAKVHVKPSRVDGGGIRTKELKIHISNLSIVDPKTSQPLKVGYKYLDDGSKLRFSKKTGEIIPKEGN